MPRYDSDYQNRRNLRSKLAWEWLLLQRPDVAQKIEEETEKAFPRKYGPRKISLPESLQQLK